MKTLLISSQKGGSGKTALARNLSAAAAVEGRRVLLIDLDPQRTSRRWLERRQADEPSMLDNDPEPSELAAALKGAARHFDLVVVDTPPSVPAWLSDAMALADLVLIPVKPSADDLDSVGATIGAAKRAGAAIVFCLSMVKPRVAITADATRSLAQHGRIAPVNIGDRVVFAEVGATGSSVMEVKDLKAREEIVGLWEYLREIL
jgi:chromosome partitioning protein